jgi:lysophospholipase
MLPLKFAGTYLTNGLPTNQSDCITGFDQASFVMGTSSSFFNVCHVITWKFLWSRLDLLLQAVLNVTDGNFGFDTSNGDEGGMNFIFNQLSSHTPSNVMDAANWPNVCIITSTYSTHLTVSTAIQRYQSSDFSRLICNPTRAP